MDSEEAAEMRLLKDQVVTLLELVEFYKESAKRWIEIAIEREEKLDEGDGIPI